MAPSRRKLLAFLLVAGVFRLCAAREEFDIPYAVNNTATSDSQMLDLYVPDMPGFPTVIFVQGGLWRLCFRKLEPYRELARRFRDCGYGFAVMSHRVSPLYKHPAHVRDVAAAFSWVRGNIAARGGNPDKVFLMGHSSGGHLAALVVSDPQYLARHSLTPRDVRGCILLGAPLDLFSDEYRNMPVADDFTTDIAGAFWDDREAYRNLSPAAMTHPGLPPILLIVGERDHEPILVQAHKYVEVAKTVGVEPELFVVPERDHKSIIFQLGKAGDPELPRIFEFIDSH
jgi:acetyl esterase/lipase